MKKRGPSAGIMAALLLMQTPALAQTGAAPSPALVAAADAATRALLASEDLRFQAEASGDTATLERLIASDCVYSHFTGMRQNKAAVIAMFAALHFTAITPSERYARVLGDVGFVRGKVARQLPGRVLSDGYVAVYAHRDGRWQLLEWASIAPPPA